MKKLKSMLVRHRMPIYGGVLTTVFTGLAVYFLGNLSGHEAMQLLETSLPRVSMLLNTIILGSATILALLLTLLGISSGAESRLKKTHYRQVLSLARFDSFLFVVALILFQLFSFPVTEAENVATEWYKIIYWCVLFASSLLSGLMVAVILMLYSTIHNIICIVGLGQQEHHLVGREEEEGDPAGHQSEGAT